MNENVENPFIENKTRKGNPNRTAKSKTLLGKLTNTCRPTKAKVVIAIVLLIVVAGLVLIVYQNRNSNDEDDVVKRPSMFKVYHGMKFERISSSDRKPIEIFSTIPSHQHHRCSFEFVNGSFHCDWLKLLTNRDAQKSFRLNTDDVSGGCKGVTDFEHDNFYRFARFSVGKDWEPETKHSAVLVSPRLTGFPHGFTLSFYHIVSCDGARMTALLVRESREGPFETIQTLFNSSATVDHWKFFKTSVSLPKDGKFYRVILKAEITKKGNGTCKSFKICENEYETQKVVVDEILLEQNFPSCKVEENHELQPNWTLHGGWKRVQNARSIGVRPRFLHRLNVKQLFTGRENFFGLKLVDAHIKKTNYKEETLISSDLMVANDNCSCELSFEWAKLNQHNSSHRIPMQVVQIFGVGSITRKKTLWSNVAGFDESGVWNFVKTRVKTVDDNVPFRIEFYEVKDDKSSSLWFLLDKIKLLGCNVKKY